MRARNGLLMVLVIAALTAAVPALAAGTITGIVSNAATGAPVAGATVTLSTGQSRTTASDGSYSFTGLAALSYTVSAVSMDYYAKSKQVTLAEDATAQVDIKLVAYATPVPAVSDTFSRDPGADLGTTEDANQYPWVPSAGETAASIADGALALTGNEIIGGVSVGGGFAPADFDLSVDMTVTGPTWGGIAYRQAHPGTFDIFWGQPAEQAGYLIYCLNGGTSITLHRNGAIATAAISVDWTQPHNLRVRVVGSRHQVWIDGTLVFDVFHGGKLTGGYIGCLRHSSGGTMTFDNLEIAAIASPTGTIAGKVSDADNPSVGVADATVRVAGGGETTTDANGEYSIEADATGYSQIVVSHNDYYSRTISGIEVLPDQSVTQDVLLTHLPVPTTEDIVFDTFSRWEGLGTTEDAGQHPWVTGSAEVEGSATVDMEQLRLATGPVASGVSIGGEYLPNDIDMTVDLMITGGAWAGIGYRQAVPGTFGSFNGQTSAQCGYMVYFMSDGTSVSIIRDGAPFATKTLDTPIDWWSYRTVRIRAIGSHHQVWVDGSKVLDVLNSEKLGGGYVSLLRWDGEAFFDNLTVTAYGEAPGQISGVVTDAADPNIRLAGATVTLDSGRTAVTNANGEYLIDRLALGTYVVNVLVDGYYPKRSAGVTLAEANPTAVQDMAMVAAPPPMDAIYDSFDRPNNSELGVTEDPLHLPWLKPIDGDTTPRILGNKLAVDPFPVAGVTLGNDFMPADLDVSVDMSIYPGVWGGIAYRQSSPGTFDNHHGADLGTTGYLVWCPDNGSAIHFFRAGAFLKSATFSTPIDWFTPHNLRVRAIGNHHEVWLDNVKVIDAYDSGKISGGYVSLMRDNTAVDFDNFTLIPYETLPEATISGVVSDAETSQPVAGATVNIDGRSTTADAQGAYSINISGVATATGPVYMTVSAPGYLNTTVMVADAAPDQSTTKDVALPKLTGANMVYDTFSRPDSTSVGRTEDDFNRPWVLSSVETQASIAGGQLQLAPGVIASGVSVGGNFLPADLEMTVDLTIESGDWAGVGYRHAVPGTFGSFGGQSAAECGYMIYCLGDGSSINIIRDGMPFVVHPMSPAVNWKVPHTLKARAIGSRHQVWLDGQLIIDAYNGEKLAGGFVTLIRWNAMARYDNFAAVFGGLLPDSIKPAVPVESVVEAKTQDDGTLVEMANPVVVGVFDGFFYVEDADRTSGIKIVGSQSVSVGDVVTVKGELGTADNERYITADSVQVTGTGQVKALGLNGRAFGGGVGLSNIGLLTTLCGTVTAVSSDQTYCYVDDGSGVSNETGTTGLKVVLPATKKPVQGDYVTCVGVAGMTGGVPSLMLRTDADLVILE